MIRRITLQNYMSHASTVIEPAAGLTVLVGPNNCGKSAVVSALETLCNNASGSYMVRHDEREARVTVETDDEHIFVWKRRGNVVSYSIDGRDIHRVGRGVPEDLHRLLKLPKVDAGENSEPFDIHFGSQKSPIFLLNEPESRAAVFFASSSDAAILLDMQKRHRLKVKDRKNDEKRYKSEIERYDAELKSLEPLQKISIAVSQTESDYAAITDITSQIQLLTEKIDSIQKQSIKHDRVELEYKSLKSLCPSPVLADFTPVESQILVLIDAERTQHREKALSNILETLAQFPKFNDVPSLANILRRLTLTNRSFNQDNSVSKSLSSLQPVPALKDVEKLDGLYQKLYLQVGNHDLFSVRLSCLNQLRNAPMMEQTNELNQIITNLSSKSTMNMLDSSRHGVLSNLLSPPAISIAKPLEDLMRRMEISLGSISSNTRQIAAVQYELQELDSSIRVAQNEISIPGGQIKPETPRRSRLILVFCGFAVVASAFLFVRLATNIFHGSNNPSSDLSKDPIAISEVQINGKGQKQSPATPEIGVIKDPNKETKREGFKKEEPKKEEPKKEEPKKEEPNKAKNEARLSRLKQIRQLLDDADAAIEKGKYLDAVLGFGQAAVLYPMELPEVARIEEVRTKFLMALQNYRTQVEKALDNSGKLNPNDK